MHTPRHCGTTLVVNYIVIDNLLIRIAPFSLGVAEINSRTLIANQPHSILGSGVCIASLWFSDT